MLKFFRRIRQQLISENSFSKYLLYALGKLKSQRVKIVHDLQYQNLIARIIGELWIQSIHCSDIQKDYQQILYHLNKEIDKRGIEG